MKKIIALGFLLLFTALSLTAGPAYPGKITYTQPDGSKINIYLHVSIIFSIFAPN